MKGDGRNDKGPCAQSLILFPGWNKVAVHVNNLVLYQETVVVSEDTTFVIVKSGRGVKLANLVLDG